MSLAGPPQGGIGGGLYRPNVGVVVFNDRGLAWLGQRVGTPGPHNWQFPQGGVDEGEDLIAAARRELMEETGISSVSLLAQTEGWITYDFPPGHKGAKAARGFIGQAQAWFAFRFEGEDSEVNLQAHLPAEFQAWKWATLDEAAKLVVPFKRDAYALVLDAFRRFGGD